MGLFARQQLFKGTKMKKRNPFGFFFFFKDVNSSRNEVIREITGFQNLLAFPFTYLKSAFSITKMIPRKKKNNFQSITLHYHIFLRDVLDSGH